MLLEGIYPTALQIQIPSFPTPPPSKSRDKEMAHFGLQAALSAYKDNFQFILSKKKKKKKDEKASFPVNIDNTHSL